MTNNDRRNWQVFGGVSVLVGGLAIAWLAGAGNADENLRFTMRQSAYIAFLLYIVVLVARPLQELLRKNWTATLLRNRRLVGVSFAATMTVHLGLIMYRFSGMENESAFDPFGATAYTVFYLMLITSFDAPRKALGLKAWKILHRTGLIIAAYIFAVPRPLGEISEPDYLKFGIPFAIALLIRMTSWLRSRRPGRQRS